MNIDTNQLLQIIGAKEVEIQVLRERLAQLEAKNKESKPLEKDDIDG